MNYTTHKKIQKPISIEKYNIGVFNTNMDIIDSELNKHDIKDNALEKSINDEVTRAKKAESDETTRATNAESDLDSKKANINNPNFTGVPKAPTASIGTNTTQIATTAFTQAAISNHNTSNTVHTDIRNLIAGLTNRLNALADSDDTTLDQLSEIVAYIKNNKSLINSVTTSKVNVSDIVNSLTSTVTNKPLSAKQGQVLKELIDNLKSALNTHIDDSNIHITTDERINWNDANSKKHTHSNKSIIDKITQVLLDNWNAAYNHISDAVKHITSAERTKWNAAEKNAIISIKKNGTALSIDFDRSVNITTPTKVSELSNDKGFITASDVDTSQNHTHTNKSILDATTASYTTTEKDKLDYTNVAYCTCSTGAATAAKVATIDGNSKFVLKKGAIAIIKFLVTNTASSCTLNVGNTGAKNIWYNTGQYTGNSNQICGYANRTLIYVYDGTYWVWVFGGFDANNTYNPMTLGGGYGTCSTAAATAAKVATLSGYNLINGGIVAIKFTYAVPASATLNINGKGAKAIYYRGSAIAANLIQAGDIVTFVYNGSQYHIITVDRSLASSSGGTQVVYQSSEPTSNLASGMIWIG